MKVLYIFLLFSFCKPILPEKDSTMVYIYEEADEEGPEIDFDLVLCPEYDPDNPGELRPQEKYLVDYIPPFLRTIAFKIFRSYIVMHIFIAEKTTTVKKYMMCAFKLIADKIMGR